MNDTVKYNRSRFPGNIFISSTEPLSYVWVQSPYQMNSNQLIFKTLSFTIELV